MISKREEEESRHSAQRPLPARELWLGHWATLGGSARSLVLDDGPHSDEEGVQTAAKLMDRIFAGKETYPWLVVEVKPLPDGDPPIDEEAAEICAGLVGGDPHRDFLASP